MYRTTRLHSSRMRTACALTVSHSMLAGGGGVCSRGWVPGPGGCLLGGVSGPGGVCSGGGGVVNPSVNRITDACKNITLLQLRCGR